MEDYAQFLSTKLAMPQHSGIQATTMPERLFPFQREVTSWACERGRNALFLDTGLGKTACQLTWAANIAQQKGDVLILAPLAVSQQTVNEGALLDIPVTLCRTGSDVRPGINITNYERLHHFNTAHVVGIVLDESSIIKSHDGKTRNALIERFRDTPYRLCCTATPSPNSFMELGNHSEFLGIMTRSEMLATYFTHDGGNTSEWRLKGHGQEHYWRWIASWAVALNHPKHLGDMTPGYDLPPLERHMHQLSLDVAHEGLTLFPMEARTLQEQRAARRAGLDTRVAATIDTVKTEPNESWLIWCELNDEADILAKSIPDAIQIAGRDSIDEKEQRLLDFMSGKIRVLVSKPSITGWGCNMQHCARMAFVGINNSFESLYQAVRRCWRFGQRRSVHAHFFYTNIEAAIVRNLARKEQEAEAMHTAMTQAVLSQMHWQKMHAAYTPTNYMQIPSWLVSE